ncbi:MAG: alpha/beta fold hydrolase [Porticoccaceae bacterium]|nr:alpha/beta fold hydrolase [Porticoccaceae bacterium]
MAEPMTFKPPLPLRSGHLQTILNGSRLRNKLAQAGIQRVNNSAQVQIIDCGEGVRLVGAYNHSLSRQKLTGSNKPLALVVLIHGWEGSFESNYMLTAAHTLLNAGYDVFRLNMRDHGPSLHLNQALFNATLTEEITRAIATITEKYRPSSCFLAGYSLGGNFALRIAADSGVTLNITATMAICPPLDPAVTMTILEKPWSPYQFYFFKKWRSSLQSKLAYFPELNYGSTLNRCKNLADINRFFIPEHTPHSTPGAYFAAYALTGQRLSDLDVPALLVTSRDDPIIPAKDLALIPASEKLEIELLSYGGHCGFLNNKRLESWVEQRMVNYFNQYHPLRPTT